MHFVVIMDPPATVLVDADTTFALMEAAQARGHRVDHCLARDVSLRGAELYARVRRATVHRDPARPIALGEFERVDLATVDAVFIRTDPPFDATYLYLTLLLDRLEGITLVLNRPSALRAANEKLYACNFTALMPETLVTSDKAEIRAFVREVGGRAVIKPLDGAGGEGVMVLGESDFNFNAIVEATTRNGSRIAMVQAFLPQVREGDKRILLLDGVPLGAILRVPKAEEVRSNIHVGGSVVKAELSAADEHIVQALGPQLRADGLHFVGLDVIGGKLTEVNVTSPTGIQQMSRLDGVDYSATVIDWVEQQVPR